MRNTNQGERLYNMSRTVEGLDRLADSAVDGAGSLLAQAHRRRRVAITLAKLEMEINLAAFSLHVMSGKAEIMRTFREARNEAYRNESNERAEFRQPRTAKE